MKVLKIRTFILFTLDFPNNTILSYVFFFLLIIDLYLLITSAIVQIFNPIGGLVIPRGMTRKETKAEIETHQLIAEAKIIKCLYNK